MPLIQPASADDLTGRHLGSQCGKPAWGLAQKYFYGTILSKGSLVTSFPRSDRGEFESGRFVLSIPPLVSAPQRN